MPPPLPPVLPHLVYERVVRAASIDGRLLLIISGPFAILAAMAGNVVPAIAACLAAGMGALELHGAYQLGQGDPRGVDWLVRAQLLLMVVILSYASYQMTHFNVEFYREQMPQFMEMAHKIYPPDHPLFDLNENEILMLFKASYMILYTAVGIMTCIYQGLMARYYHKRRGPILQFLDIVEE